MKRIIVLLLAICIFFSGCGALTDGEHIWTQVHSIPKAPSSNLNITAQSYDQLYQALVDMVAVGATQATISVERYDRSAIETDAQTAVDAVRQQDPIAAYAVAHIEYTLGTTGGETVLAVQILYQHDYAQIRKIIHVADTEAAREEICAALVACEPGIVLLMEQYEQRDLAQMVEDYAREYPELVMETPQVAVNVYPEEGQSRVVELKFTYQTSRDTLKNMQSQVENLFKSARFFTSGYHTERRRFMRLYTWLMETNEYTIQTSITPAYSLLLYGTGDSRAFATVYASLCRQMELECMTVSGTKNGESWYWNLICINDVYYHLDLLECSSNSGFALCTDGQMEGYVWDYNAYPVSPDPEPEPTEPATTAPIE